MKLRSKFNTGILVIFFVLTVSISIINIHWINKVTLKETEHRVKVYIRAAWTIHNNKIKKILSVLETLAQDNTLEDFMINYNDVMLRNNVIKKLENIRKIQNMDFLNLISPKGKVILRSKLPNSRNDNILNDAIVNKVIKEKRSVVGNIIFASDRLNHEGEDLINQCLKYGGVPEGLFICAAVPLIENGDFIGVLEMGKLLNGSVEEVDEIRDSVFENEYYRGKPLGTATIFMRDIRVSTNVKTDNGKRAIGTKVSAEVADHVLKKGLSWTGRAWVVNAWYLSQYDPIKDPKGNIIGMFYVGELEEKYLDMRKSALVWHLAVVFAGLLLTLLIFYLITRAILKPLNQLSLATKKLADGNLSYRINVETKDEIGALANLFNTMAEKLEENRKELEKTNESLRITNKNYMDMLSFVTHELKSPLAAATMGLYTVKDGYLGKITDVQKKNLEIVAKNIDYINEMIKNYLDLSRIEKGEIRVNKNKVCLLKEVVNPILEALSQPIKEKGIYVENNINNEITLLADRDLLKIVYDNLLSNAIKYGKEKGKIVLNVEDRDGILICSVYNEGIGIPKDKIGLLFKKFSRIYDPEHMDKKGSGLGLFICKEIIEKHGGQIWVESEEGKWANFIFKIPKE